MIGQFLCNFEKPHSYVKVAVATSWETFWLLFTPTFGHTDFAQHDYFLMLLTCTRLYANFL